MSSNTQTALNEPVGLMNPAFAVGRHEILTWLNILLKLRLQKIEETCSGAVACQIMDVLFPNAVQMHKINWGARSDWEYVANYKILQIACDKVNVDRKIEVDRLIKGRVQDNLEFLQWLKKFYENNVGINGDPANYDAPARRALGKNVGMLKWTVAAKPTTMAATTTTPSTTTKLPSPKPATPPSNSPPHQRKHQKENATSNNTSNNNNNEANNHTIAVLEQSLIRAEGKLSEIEALIRGSGDKGALAMSILDILGGSSPNGDVMMTMPTEEDVVDDEFQDTSADW